MTDIQALSTFAKALSDPSRLRIVNVLRNATLCVCELTDVLQMRQSTLSTHLQVLRSSGIVTRTKRGTWVEYSIDPTFALIVEAVYAEFTKRGPVDHEIERRAKRVGLRMDGCCVASGALLPRESANAV